MGGLNDQTPDVRRASATALGSFGSEAQPAIPALRKAAASDRIRTSPARRASPLSS